MGICPGLGTGSDTIYKLMLKSNMPSVEIQEIVFGLVLVPIEIARAAQIVITNHVIYSEKLKLQ